MPGTRPRPAEDDRSCLRALVEEARSLGVGEVARRMTGAEHARPGVDVQARLDFVVDGLLEAVRLDQPVVGQLVKEVWSRGSGDERRVAARAVGRAMSGPAPHRAFNLGRELAGMITAAGEARMLAEEALTPLVAAHPALRERCRNLLNDPQATVQEAAAWLLVLTCPRDEAGALATQLLAAGDAASPWKRETLRELSRIDGAAVARAAGADQSASARTGLKRRTVGTAR